VNPCDEIIQLLCKFVEPRFALSRQRPSPVVSVCFILSHMRERPCYQRCSSSSVVSLRLVTGRSEEWPRRTDWTLNGYNQLSYSLTAKWAVSYEEGCLTKAENVQRQHRTFSVSSSSTQRHISKQIHSQLTRFEIFQVFSCLILLCFFCLFCLIFVYQCLFGEIEIIISTVGLYTCINASVFDVYICIKYTVMIVPIVKKTFRATIGLFSRKWTHLRLILPTTRQIERVTWSSS